MYRILSLTIAMMFVGAVAVAEETVTDPRAENTSATANKADNTSRNKRERSDSELNPTDQKENASDMAITQKVRRAVMEDKTLSTYAHNVKIITQDGIVNLKGPVRTADEKKVVEDMAMQIAGTDKVKSQLEIAPKE